MGFKPRSFFSKVLLTRWLYQHIKDGLAETSTTDDPKDTNFARNWPSYLLAIEIAVAALMSIGTAPQLKFSMVLSVRCFSCAAAICAFFRIGEIVFAYYYDAMDRLNGIQNVRPLTSADKVRLVLKSYLSLIINWALIYFAMPMSQFHTPMTDKCSYSYEFTSFMDALYFSGVTITTVGYGDILPTGPWSRGLSICEVLVAVLVLVIALGTYLGGERGSV